MPPHASQEHNDGQSPAVLVENSRHDLSLFEMPSATPKTIYSMPSDGISSLATPVILPPEKESKAAYEIDNEPETITLEDPKSSILDRLLDFNPCTIKISNPASALFKIRTCAECGDRVHKFRNGGYQKEEHLIEEHSITIFDDETEDESGVVSPANSFDSTASSKVVKAYYHGECMRLREDRAAHKDVLGTVLPELMDVVEMRERERREVEERKRRAEEEAEAAASIAQAAALAEAARNAPLEETLAKGRRSPLKRAAKKFFKSFSSKACRGASNTTAATDDSAFRGAEI